MLFFRKFRLNLLEVFQIRCKDKDFKGLLLLIDLRRKMRYEDLSSSDFFEDESEFLEQVSPNYVKSLFLSSRALIDKEKEEVFDFVSQLLDGPNDRDWDIIFNVLSCDDLKSIYNGTNLLEKDVSMYTFAREVANRYGVKLPDIDISSESMSYLSQD